jgi:hypothetical protein
MPDQQMEDFERRVVALIRDTLADPKRLSSSNKLDAEGRDRAWREPYDGIPSPVIGDCVMWL